MDVRQELEDMAFEIMKTYGLSSIQAKIIAIASSITDPLSLEELAKKTGYSLATISNSVKFLERFLLIKKFRQAGSKKIYVQGKRDMVQMLLQKVELSMEVEIKPMKKKIPEWIGQVKKDLKTSKGNKKEEHENMLKLLKEYDEQMEKTEKALLAMKKVLEK